MWPVIHTCMGPIATHHWLKLLQLYAFFLGCFCHSKLFHMQNKTGMCDTKSTKSVRTKIKRTNIACYCYMRACYIVTLDTNCAHSYIVIQLLSSSVSAMHGAICFICPYFNTSLCGFIDNVLSQFNHLLILWTCLLQWIGRWYCLLLLVKFRLRLKVMVRSVLADAVEQESTKQGSSYEGHHCSSCNCDPHTSSISGRAHSTC